MINLDFFRSGDRHNSFARKPSDTIRRRVLAASTAETVSIPTGAKMVVFSSNGDFYARTDGTNPTVPSADDSETSELNPAAYWLEGASDIRLIAPNANTIVTLAFYS